MRPNNIDYKVVNDFGLEWNKFNYRNVNNIELKKIFNDYFRIFPFNKISKNSIGFDMGSGSGRWAKFIAPKVKKLHCIEPSNLAIKQSKLNLKVYKNCIFENSSVSKNSLKDNSQDFGYSLGVLHHLPNTLLALKSCTRKLKSGAPFLLYLYYCFDNKPKWFKIIWKISDIVRISIYNLPFFLKYPISQFIAFFVYLPFSKILKILKKNKIEIKNFPLSYYHDKSFYIMRTDALDRFGTKIEKRFSRNEIEIMMKKSQLKNIKFSNKQPYWVAIGTKV
jgi:ubiquinone/menaquinone biosynthesis C-methylase UbiE